MQHNPQVFWSFDICHEVTEHTALPGTVLGQRAFGEITIERLFLEQRGMGRTDTKHKTPLLMVIGVGKKNTMTRK